MRISKHLAPPHVHELISHQLTVHEYTVQYPHLPVLSATTLFQAVCPCTNYFPPPPPPRSPNFNVVGLGRCLVEALRRRPRFRPAASPAASLVDAALRMGGCGARSDSAAASPNAVMERVGGSKEGASTLKLGGARGGEEENRGYKDKASPHISTRWSATS